ncbi:MAG: diaminopimelate epimerase [Bradymonadia bacterium]
MDFVKYHGLGNDFVIVDARLGSAFDTQTLNQETTRRICNRATGVGADGVLLVYTPENSDVSPIGMKVFNADGSVSEMCGNGLRCVARYAWDLGGVEEAPTAVETGAGVLTIHPAADRRVRVQMGAVTDHGALTIEHAGRSISGRRLSVGNPHFVMTTSEWSMAFGEGDLTDLACTHGPGLEVHEAFPHRTNVGFLGARDLDPQPFVVWERGSGLTGACGTGACAGAVAQLIAEERTSGTLTLRQPGGDLVIEVESEAGLYPVWMTGPAEYVFSGCWGKDG